MDPGQKIAGMTGLPNVYGEAMPENKEFFSVDIFLEHFATFVLLSIRNPTRDRFLLLPQHHYLFLQQYLPY